MNENKDTIIEIFSGTLWESEMIRSLLQDSGINSFLKNEVLNSYAYEPTTSGEVKVMISNSDREVAKEIVSTYRTNMKINP